MTHIIVPIFGESIESIRDDIATAVERGATMIELRLDRMPDIPDEQLLAFAEKPPADVPILLTYRRAAEGGDDTATDESRLERLENLSQMADFFDVEWHTFAQSNRNQTLIDAAIHGSDAISGSCGVEAIERGQRRSLILSKHDMKTRPAGLQGDLLRMADAAAGDVVKLAWRARSVRDNFEAFELLRIAPKPAITICMGEDGLISRVLARKFRAFGTFAALRSGFESAPGQLTILELRDRFRWDTINDRTRVYGLIGDPVKHSLSPDVHNSVFAERNLNAVYVPLHVAAGVESFKAFMVEVLARPWLDFSGFSVTLPHKENAYRFLKERGDRLDALAERCGAVNTISVLPDGTLQGWNTDCEACADVLEASVDSAKALKGSRILILGAGGAARAAVVGLKSRGANPVIANRTSGRAKSLAGEHGCEWMEWTDRIHAAPDMIVNCTPIGMSPDVSESPMPPASILPGTIVFDLVYNPLQTRLLTEAAKGGCRTVDGLSMFIQQAAAQSRIWTGHAPALETVRGVAEKALERRRLSESRSG
ncbi:MAG: shikimate dehydrogenase [Planctomycetes bacterium]|nr:shikimate dehydrogenase [Planctomycetota bacterium]